MHDIWFIVAGLFTGILVGLTGIGGGSVMTPLLVFVFGVKPNIAVGTDLLFAAITKSVGTGSMLRQGLVDWRIVATLSAGSLPAAGITLALIAHWGAGSPRTHQLILTTLGIALWLTAASIVLKLFVLRPKADQIQKASVQAKLAPPPVLAVVAFGAVIGTLVTLTSVGAGAIGVSVLMLLYPYLPLPRLVAIDIAYAVPLTLVAGLGHASLGSVDWSLLGLLLAGSLPGIWLGTRYIKHIPEKFSRSLVAVMLAWAGSKMLLA
jgi:uncharacterized protein